ncbi:hypothetical protein DFH08DRAFT_874465 [Mycena albidolilacea]|uniref:Uncharacterized protein n=1 Tax=Mycena albidolilacea TaxID=1033008 RepID=A0AAD6ZWX0_9AGAR|nr:hypothetical protein DFH08DRAFT_874465 [Mycena albidolilacea]
MSRSWLSAVSALWEQTRTGGEGGSISCPVLSSPVLGSLQPNAIFFAFPLSWPSLLRVLTGIWGRMARSCVSITYWRHHHISFDTSVSSLSVTQTVTRQTWRRSGKSPIFHLFTWKAFLLKFPRGNNSLTDIRVVSDGFSASPLWYISNWTSSYTSSPRSWRSGGVSLPESAMSNSPPA